jgi:hypothetical protein
MAGINGGAPCGYDGGMSGCMIEGDFFCYGVVGERCVKHGVDGTRDGCIGGGGG